MDGEKINLYTTWVQAINPTSGSLELFSGPIVPGKTVAEAQKYCDTNNLAYCMVDAIFTTTMVTAYTNLN